MVDEREPPKRTRPAGRHIHQHHKGTTMRPILLAIAIAMVALMTAACTKSPVSPEPALASQAETTGQEEPGATPKMSLLCHKYMVYHAARKLGLSTTRMNQMMKWAAKPDTIDNEGTIPGTQQWRHGYVYIGGVYSWGGAAERLDMNVYGTSGYLGKSAGYYYAKSDKVNGDYHLGYALHYLADVGNPYHTNADIVSQLKGHGNYEKWLENNWSSGRNFSADWTSSTTTVTYSSIRDYVRKLSKYSYNNSGKVSGAFAASGYPTASGTGNDTLVKYTRLQIKETAKYMRGCIKKVMDQYSVW